MEDTGHRKYAYWRTDKPKDPGYSHELIPYDFDKWKSETNTVDDMNCWPFEGITTLSKALER